MPNCRLLPIGLICCLLTSRMVAQTTLDGYIFEQYNRGFLQQAKVTVYVFPDNIVRAELHSDTLGHFGISLTPGLYRITAQKDVFYDRSDTIEIKTGKNYLKMEMHRKPGYLFDVTLAESRDNSDIVVDGVDGANIEVYNRTQHQLVLNLPKHPYAFFQHTFEQGNHYTMLIRKPGYLAKRIEIYVNIKGCILCVDGVRTLSPGVSANLTAGNTMGTLVANIEMTRAQLDKKIRLQMIYYDYNKWDIREDAAVQLDKVVTLLKDNPGLEVELGSHTDSRGNDQYNLKLSQRRAEAAVAYIISQGIDSTRIRAKGYGETQLVNRCKNGVACTEEDHQQNRRTELKITGVSGDSLEYLHWQGLEQIIQQEEREAGERSIRQQTTARAASDSLQIKIEAMDPDFSGFSIEIAHDEKQIPVGDLAKIGIEQVFFREFRNGSRGFFVCGTATRKETFDWFRTKLRPICANAHIVQFAKGKPMYLN